MDRRRQANHARVGGGWIETAPRVCLTAACVRSYRLGVTYCAVSAAGRIAERRSTAPMRARDSANGRSPVRRSGVAPGGHELDAVLAGRESFQQNLPLGRGQNGGTVPAPRTGAPVPTAPPPVATQTVASDTPTTAPTEGCVINHRATVHAPDGTPDSRTTIGVCETIVFDVGGRVVDWSSDSGWPSARRGRATYEWAAPERARTSTITATDPATGESCQLDMDVIAPTGTRLHNVF